LAKSIVINIWKNLSENGNPTGESIEQRHLRQPVAVDGVLERSGNVLLDHDRIEGRQAVTCVPIR